ncbi:MAG: GtrA family protein [Candidatus Saccharimonadales bacterium]
MRDVELEAKARNDTLKSPTKLFWFLYLHSFIRYLFVGGSTLCIDLSVLIFLHGHLKVNLTLSTTAGYWLSVTYNFFMNRHWVFSAQQSKTLREHALLYGCLLTVNYIYTVIGVNALTHHISYEFAKIVVIMVSIVWTYPIYKRYIFYVSDIDVNSGGK